MNSEYYLEIARIQRQLANAFREASTVPPPQVQTPNRLDVRNDGNERRSKKKPD